MNALAERLQQFYLEAAAATYAGNAVKRETIPDLPGSKVYRYRSDNLSYVDIYFTDGEKTDGKTIIFRNGKSAWSMSYHGWCKNDDPVVLSFLKQALVSAYRRGKFFGGRGLPKFESTRSDDLVYENYLKMPPYSPQDFTDFVGHERIYRKPDFTEDVFWHRYQGYMIAN